MAPDLDLVPCYNKQVPNKIIMDILHLRASIWLDHYNFLLSLTSLYEEWECKWFKEECNFNKIYDC
jgi:hypothetical protein